MFGHPPRDLDGRFLDPLAASQGDRMRRTVDLLELANGHLCVDLGGGDVGVAKLRLYVANVSTVVEHRGRYAVAKGVA